MAVFVNPKLGVVLIWPLLFLYPHLYMAQQGLIPWNMGVDDLFICFLFLIMITRRNLFEGRPFRMGFAVWFALIFCFILIANSINGYMATHTSAIEFSKRALKGIVFVFFAYCIVNSTDHIDDLKRLVFAFSLFAAAGAVIIILMKFFPEPMKVFAYQRYIEHLEWNMTPPPSGAFGNRNSAAIVLDIAILSLVMTMRWDSKFFTRGVRWAAICIMVIALLFTRSRSGFLCLAIPIGLMTLYGKNKLRAVLFLFLGGSIFLLFFTSSTELFARFTSEDVAQGTAGFWSPILIRLEHIRDCFNNVSLSRLIMGQSSIADQILDNPVPHSAYFGILLIYGIGGVIWTVVLVWYMLKYSRILKRYPDDALSSMGAIVQWGILIFALYGVVGDPFSSYITRFTVFYLVILAQRGMEMIYEHQWYEAIEGDNLYNSYPELSY